MLYSEKSKEWLRSTTPHQLRSSPRPHLPSLSSSIHPNSPNIPDKVLLKTKRCQRRLLSTPGLNHLLTQLLPLNMVWSSLQILLNSADPNNFTLLSLVSPSLLKPTTDTLLRQITMQSLRFQMLQWMPIKRLMRQTSKSKLRPTSSREPSPGPLPQSHQCPPSSEESLPKRLSSTLANTHHWSNGFTSISSRHFQERLLLPEK